MISLAPKKVDVTADAKPGPINDANTSDRNAVDSLEESVDSPESPSSSTNGSGVAKAGKPNQSNGSTTKAAGAAANGNGNAGEGSSQLATKVGHLNLAAPGTSNSANAKDIAENGSSDDKRQM